jgi:hypothetical protein
MRMTAPKMTAGARAIHKSDLHGKLAPPRRGCRAGDSWPSSGLVVGPQGTASQSVANMRLARPRRAIPGDE